MNPLSWKDKPLALLLEFLFFFVFLPTLIYLQLFKLPRMAALLIFAIYCVTLLWKDKSFQKERLWSSKILWNSFKNIKRRLLLISLAIILLAYLINPSNFFKFPFQHPFIWIIILFAYPIFSAYLQEIIYRAFFFNRYKILFPQKYFIVFMSALSFSFVHIIYYNYTAIVFTFFGGLLFAATYDKYENLSVPTFEHSVYGLLIFTTGLGEYFTLPNALFFKIFGGSSGF